MDLNEIVKALIHRSGTREQKFSLAVTMTGQSGHRLSLGAAAKKRTIPLRK